MTVQDAFRRKLYSLIYPKGTPTLDGENSTYLGTTSPYELPENLDDFYRIWFADFNGWTKWFGPFRSVVSGSRFWRVFPVPLGARVFFSVTTFSINFAKFGERYGVMPKC